MSKNHKISQVAPPVKRKSLKLVPSDWFWLDELAADTKSSYRGKPTWRRLIARIARGQLVVSERQVVAVEKSRVYYHKLGKVMRYDAPSKSWVRLSRLGSEVELQALCFREGWDLVKLPEHV